MPEISEERLVYFEALEAVATRMIRPIVEDGHAMARQEETSRCARTWTDAEVEQAMAGSALWDDRPRGWRKQKLLTYSRGELAGRGIVGGNLEQYFWKVIQALADPVTSWHEWRLSFLEMCAGTACSDPCTGTYQVDADRIGLVCTTCQAFYSYEQVLELIRAGEEAKAAQEREERDGDGRGA